VCSCQCLRVYVRNETDAPTTLIKDLRTTATFVRDCHSSETGRLSVSICLCSYLHQEQRAAGVSQGELAREIQILENHLSSCYSQQLYFVSMKMCDEHSHSNSQIRGRRQILSTSLPPSPSPSPFPSPSLVSFLTDLSPVTLTLASLALSSLRVSRPTIEPLRSYLSSIGHCELKALASTQIITSRPFSDTSYNPQKRGRSVDGCRATCSK
jgi:hypothetical protein